MPERFFTGFILEAYVYVTTAAQKEAAETMGKSSQYKIGFVYRLFSCSLYIRVTETDGRYKGSTAVWEISCEVELVGKQ